MRGYEIAADSLKEEIRGQPRLPLVPSIPGADSRMDRVTREFSWFGGGMVCRGRAGGKSAGKGQCQEVVASM